MQMNSHGVLETTALHTNSCSQFYITDQ